MDVQDPEYPGESVSQVNSRTWVWSRDPEPLQQHHWELVRNAESQAPQQLVNLHFSKIPMELEKR